jgi:sugar O-acyltransferase (sialic acid O-acetyltransferase NeuD family)
MSVRVLILGAGGHGQVVADILLRMQETGTGVVPIGYLDDNPALAGEQLLGLPILGTVADLGAIAHDALVVAIGDNRIRQRLFESLRAQGERFVVAHHPSAVIAPDVPVGPGSMICAGVVVCPGSVVGANVLLNTSCTVDHHNQVADHVHITPGVHLGGEVTVGEGVFLGIGSSVIPRRTIGPWARVGVGSVVTKDIPAGATAVGVPARVVRQADDGPSPHGH